VHADLIPYLPQQPGSALDVGAGSGRDAAWLAARGWTVTAVEPSKLLREKGHLRHPDNRIEWIDDALPHLSRTLKLKQKFDLILLSAVWMHVPPASQEVALAALVELSARKSILAISVRNGGDENRRGFYATDMGQLKQLAIRSGFSLVAESISRDRFDRSDVAWTSIILQYE
jgi:SAM-dependent methyltransferase